MCIDAHSMEGNISLNATHKNKQYDLQYLMTAIFTGAVQVTCLAAIFTVIRDITRSIAFLKKQLNVGRCRSSYWMPQTSSGTPVFQVQCTRRARRSIVQSFCDRRENELSSAR